MADSPPSPPAWRAPGAWFVLLAVLIGGLALDLGTKQWSFRTIADIPVTVDREQLLADPTYNPIPLHPGKQAIPWALDFRLVLNRGAVFGIGADQRGFLIAFTGGALIVGLLMFARWTTRRQTLAHIAIGLVLAGGVGNLYDRIVFGAVRDFLNMLPRTTLPFGWTWPGGAAEIFPWVFNIADMMLLAGMALLLVHVHLADRRAAAQKHAQETQAETSPSPAPAEVPPAE